MAGRGWVASTRGDRWVLSCDPSSVKVADVFKTIVLQTESERRRKRATEVETVIKSAITGAEQSLDGPVQLLAGNRGDDGDEVNRSAPR
jgi:hypothetical protein